MSTSNVATKRAGVRVVHVGEPGRRRGQRPLDTQEGRANMRRRTELMLGMMASIMTVFLLTPPLQATAGEFRVILWNVTDVKDPQAHIDVGLDTGGAPGGTNVDFAVYDPEGILFTPSSQFTLPVTANGLVSSSSAAPPNDNLFAVSGGQPASVTVKFPPGVTNANAVLYQTLKSSKIVLGVAWQRDAADLPVAIGKLFPVTLGPFSRASLLVANVSGSQASVDVFIGSKGPDGKGTYTIPLLKPNSIGRLDLDPIDARSLFVLSSTGDIVAQLVVDTGKSTVTEVTLVPVH